MKSGGGLSIGGGHGMSMSRSMICYVLVEWDMICVVTDREGLSGVPL
jgi:hypothetical protein